MNLVTRKSWLPLVRAVLEGGQDRSQVQTISEWRCRTAEGEPGFQSHSISEDSGRDVKEESKAQAREECSWRRNESCVFAKMEIDAKRGIKTKLRNRRGNGVRRQRLESKCRILDPLARNQWTLQWQLDDLTELSDFNDAHKRDKPMWRSRLSLVDFCPAFGEEIKAKW